MLAVRHATCSAFLQHLKLRALTTNLARSAHGLKIAGLFARLIARPFTSVIQCTGKM